MRADGVRQAAIGIGVLLALGGPAGAQEWTAQEIVDRAVARADAQRDAQDDIRYRATFEAVTERLNGDGEVEETERETYEQYPLEGVIYEELVAREGMPLTAADERKEQERRREFVEEVRERRAREIDPRPEDENRVELNEDFISRYQYSIVGEEVRDGHDCWIVQLVPRPGDSAGATPNRHRAQQVDRSPVGGEGGLRREPGRVRDGRAGPLLGRHRRRASQHGRSPRVHADRRGRLAAGDHRHPPRPADRLLEPEAAHRPAVDGVHPYPRDRSVGRAGGLGSARVPPSRLPALLHEYPLRVGRRGPHFSGPSAGATLRG